MANVLGSLFVNLVANTADFVGGMEKAGYAARRAGREIDESFSKVGDIAGRVLGPLGEVGEKLAATFENVGNVAGKAMSSVGAFGAVTAGVGVAAASLGAALVAAADHAAEIGSQIFEAGEKTGLTAEHLSGLMAITKETGTSFEGVSNAIAKAEINITKFVAGIGQTSGALVKVMNAAGGAAALGVKPLDDQVQLVLKSIFELGNEGERNVALNALLGKGWKDNVTALKLLAEQGYAPAVEQARRFGLYFNEESARQAREYKIAINELEASFGSLALTIGKEAIPKILSLMTGLIELRGEFVAFGYRAAGIATVFISGISQLPYFFGKADEVTKKAIDDATNWRVRIDDITKASTAAGKETSLALDENTGKVQKHVDLVAKAAEASRLFWERYSLGLVELTTHFPKVLSYEESFTKYLEDQAKAAAKVSQEIYNAMRAGEFAKAGFTLPGGVPGGILPLPGATGRAALTPLPIEEMAAPYANIKNELTSTQAFFQSFFKQVADQGKDFAERMKADMAGAVGAISDQFARLAVTGRTSFRELFQSFAQEMIRANIDKIFSEVAGKISNAIHIKVPGSGAAAAAAGGPKGTAIDPIWVKSAETSLPGAGGTAGGGEGDTAGIQAATAAAGVFGAISKLFGGGKAGGGDVSPGRFYIVGERNPELFVPRQSGRISPALQFSGQPTIVNFHVHGVSDYDSFRRSSGQIMAHLQNQLATAYARNR